MDLSQLAAVLKENGDQVLNGESKLSLSTKLLKELNESFGMIIEEREALSSTFQVISASNSKVELLLDLQFLHDFIQRAIGLKLVEDNRTSDVVNINKFKNLKLLEIRRIPVNQIVGLQDLRTQLQYLVCVRSLGSLKELFVSCGGDKSHGFVWSELKEAVLTYNNLETIDSSVEYVPWLQILDVSHNSIVNAQAIGMLPNLKHLNLGFNHLEAVPVFKRDLCRNLQVLILKGNYIEDLTGLLYLDNLVTLDLSCNCIVDHQSLSVLPQLAALQWLNLEGNPLSFHPHHRTITARYLHPNATTVKFVLDQSLLSKSEKLLIGTNYTTISGKLVMPKKREHLSSISSNVSELTNSSEATGVLAPELTRSQSIQRGRKVRDAIISETEETSDVRDDMGEIINPELLKSVSSISSTHMLNDSVETQKKIKSLRDQYGKEWLKSKGGSIMQDILGMEKTPEIRLSSTPYEQDFMIHAADVLENRTTIASAATGRDELIIGVVEKSSDITTDTQEDTTFITASDGSMFEDKDLILMDTASVSSNDEQMDEGEEQLYLAQIQREELEPEEVFIVITDKYIKERDTSSGRTRGKWLLEVIVCCEIVCNHPSTVRIEFDTVRRNMKQRKYVLEDDDATKLLRAVSNITSQRSLAAMNQTVYSCMKCSSQFTRDKTNTIVLDRSSEMPQCQNCGSTLIYEIDDDATPTNHSLAQGITINLTDRARSPSECSIASETENNPLAQIHVTAEVHMDSNASNSKPSNCSAQSVQESNSSHISTEDSFQIGSATKRYESDIEVISNPSQSSIEVLDDRPGRKRSSEERRTMVAPTLVTIPDVVVPIGTTLAGLTESSSSSSFTESVCTAYDAHVTHASRPSSGLDVRVPIQEEHTDKKEEEKNKNSIISSLFEGLFAGPTIGTVAAQQSSATEDTSNEIEFSFSGDFSQVDHRIKYHLYHYVFEDEHEHFVWLLRCVVLSANMTVPVAACIVLSTHKVYILHLNEHDYGDDLPAWLVKNESYTIDRLQTIFVLPWKQGIGLEIRNATSNCINHLCVLQDVQRTSNLLTFLADNPLPDSCNIECVPPERPMLNLQQLLLSYRTESAATDTSLRLLMVFPKCTVTNSESKSATLGVFLMTSSDMILLEDVLWLLPDMNKEPGIFSSQPVNNLLEIDGDGLTLDFHFLDELAGCEEVWSLQLETMDSLNTVVSAVRAPWEEIFSVPLQINHKEHKE